MITNVSEKEIQNQYTYMEKIRALGEKRKYCKES